MQVLAQRMSNDHPLELAKHFDVTAVGEIAVDRALGRAQPQIVEPADLGWGERLVRDIGQRVPPPQRERLTRL